MMRKWICVTALGGILAFTAVPASPNECYEIKEENVFQTAAGDAAAAHALDTSAAQIMEETRAYMLSIDKEPTVGSEWFVLGLSRYGMDLGDTYFSTYYNHFANYLDEQKGILTKTVKYTEYSKAVVVMTALGKNARDIGGYDLFSHLADLEDVRAQGINGPIWALIALHTNPGYTIPVEPAAKVQTTEQVLVEYILGQEVSGGGWDLMGSSADPDITGMALQALAPLYHKEGYQEVTEAIDRALARLSSIQNPTGGYSTAGTETVESCAQVVTALCALGIDPEADGRFIKNGCWTVENLISYHIPGSGFMHVKPGSDANGGGEAGVVNGIATEQGYYALAAYQRLKEGKTALYDMSDVSLARGQKGDGKGTGLNTPEPSELPEKTVTPTPSPEGTSAADPGYDIINPTVTAGENYTSDPPDPVYIREAAAAATRTATAVPQNTSGALEEKKKKKTESQDTETGGWDFEGEVYTEKAEGWDFGAEEPAVGDADAKAMAVGDPGQGRQPFSLIDESVAKGIVGAAAFEVCRYLWMRRKGRK